jgi:hypothetical protein
MKRSDIVKKNFPETNTDFKEQGANNKLAEMIASGYLKVSQLDPNKTYIWTVGNLEEGIYPNSSDLLEVRDLIDIATQKYKDLTPHFVLSPANLIQEPSPSNPLPPLFPGDLNSDNV